VLAVSQTCCGGADDNGLMGIAVDPQFETNRWIYVWYSPDKPDAGGNPRLRLSRFTISAQNTLVANSEKILIDLLTSKGEHRHAGGPMTFDAHGDLWVTLGQSGNDINYPTSGSQWSATDSGLNQEWGPSNTASLRGGIFRIHPDEAAKDVRTDRSGTYGPGYTIPSGNFGAYWAGQFQAKGKTDLAAQYRDPQKVLPEVYVKGNRSPYSIGVHPSKQWMTWGEVNPPNNADEINLVANPVFAGMPYFYGNNTVVTYPGTAKSVDAPTNTSPMNNGVTELPPAMPGTLVGGNAVGNVAMAGPFYVYNGNLKNRDKLPPHLHNHLFHLSFQANALYLNKIDTATAKITSTQRVEGSLMRTTLRSPLAARIGPDGALYILNYDGYYTVIKPSVMRLSYKGDCAGTVGIGVEPTPPVRRSFRGPYGFQIAREHEFSILSIDGRLLFQSRSLTSAEYPFTLLRSMLGGKVGMALVSVKTSEGRFWEKLSF
jgi:cytochrome c